MDWLALVGDTADNIPGINGVEGTADKIGGTAAAVVGAAVAAHAAASAIKRATGNNASPKTDSMTFGS